jgi:hypothetical protein
MTNRNKKVYEMLVRVVVFRSTYSNLIVKGSLEDKLFDLVEAALRKLDEHSKLQTSGKNAGTVTSGERLAAREDLRTALETLCRTAASMGLKQFFMPRDRSDRSLANVGTLFISLAEPLKDAFIANHLPVDFIETLKTAVDRIEVAIKQQAVTKGTHTSATVGIASAQAEAFEALAKLDPIIENLLRENEPAKAVWDAARHVEKSSYARKATATEAPPTSTTAA